MSDDTFARAVKNLLRMKPKPHKGKGESEGKQDKDEGDRQEAGRDNAPKAD